MATKEQTSNKAINASIAKIGRNETALRDNVQKTLVLITRHAHEYGDCSGLARLVNKLSRGVTRVSGITAFMAAHTSIRIGADPKVKGQVRAHLAKGDDGEKVQVSAKMVDAVVANNWYEHDVPKEATVYTDMDIRKRFENVINLCDRLIKGEAKSGTLASEATKKEVTNMRNRMKAALDGQAAPAASAVAV